MFTVALFIEAKKQKPPKCPSTDKQTNKMQYIHTTEYHSAIRSTDTGQDMDEP